MRICHNLVANLWFSKTKILNWAFSKKICWYKSQCHPTIHWYSLVTCLQGTREHWQLKICYKIHFIGIKAELLTPTLNRFVDDTLNSVHVDIKNSDILITRDAIDLNKSYFTILQIWHIATEHITSHSTSRQHHAKLRPSKI